MLVWQIGVSEAGKKQFAEIGRVEAKRITAFLRLQIAALEDARLVGDALQCTHFAGL